MQLAITVFGRRRDAQQKAALDSRKSVERQLPVPARTRSSAPPADPPAGRGRVEKTRIA
jgi:hypothetical protein